MRGLMQDWPLLCNRMIDHAAAVHGDREVVTRSEAAAAEPIAALEGMLRAKAESDHSGGK